MNLNEIPCHNYDNCKKKAMGYFNKMWLCGDCIIRLQDRVDKLKEKLILEE